VYDRNTGDIIHIFHMEVLPGAAVPKDFDPRKDALATTARLTKKGENELGIIEVDRGLIARNIHYRVDPESRQLREVARSKERPHS